MNKMVLNHASWNEMKPGNKSVSHRIPRPHAHNQPQVSREAGRMSANFRNSRAFLFPFLFCVVSIVSASGQASQPVAAKSAQSGSAAATNAPSPDVSKYVGAETCKTCHEEIYNSWEKTPHWKTTLNKAGGPSKQGCEGCHAPGADQGAGGGQ